MHVFSATELYAWNWLKCQILHFVCFTTIFKNIPRKDEDPELFQLFHKKKTYTYQMEILELKNVITELKNWMDGLKSKMEMSQERICELEDRVMEITQSEQQREKNWKQQQ